MIRQKAGGWKWILRERDVLEPWFRDYERLAELNTVKRNPVRQVFRAGPYFVKLDRPEKFFHKCRALVRPKAKVEFDTAMLLERFSVPVVKHVGWGRCGCLGMLVTEAFPNAVDVNEYWFSSFVYSTGEQAEFLKVLIDFLSLLFKSGFYHPDLHLGNILYDPENNSLALVDVYGIRKYRSLPFALRFKMGRIITNLKDGITDREACDIIVAVGLADEAGAGDMWTRLLRRNAEIVKSEWARRRRQILNNYSKYVTVAGNTDAQVLLRHNCTWKPTVSADGLMAGEFFQCSMAKSDAEAIWIKSFLLDLLGVRHINPVAMKLGADDNDVCTLYFPNTGDCELPDEDSKREFINRCFIAGVDCGGAGNVIMQNGRIVCRSIELMTLADSDILL